MYGWRLCIKTLFYKRPGLCLLVAFVSVISIGGFSLHVIERIQNERLRNIYVAMYLTTISATTVGYGDITP